MALNENASRTSFQDSRGKVWTVRVTGKEYLRIKQELGIDLMDLVADPDKVSSELADMVQQINMLQCCLREQANGNFDELLMELTGDVLYNALHALQHAVIDFFPHPETRKLLSTLLVSRSQRGQKLAALGSQKLERMIQLEEEQSVKALNQAFADLEQKITSDNSSS